MIKYKLSKRLDMLAKLSYPSRKLADIGTDHGYLPLYLLENSHIEHCILCDINIGPLENAKRSFREADFTNQTEFRLGSGIEPLEPAEVDTIVIAGMGGGLIIDILSHDLQKSLSFEKLLLQPMTEQNVLRQWLMDQGFKIKSDYYVHESSKYYEIIEISSRDDDATIDIHVHSADLEFGYRITRDNVSEYIKFLLYRRHKYETIIKQLANSASQTSKHDACVNKLITIDSILLKLKEEDL
ncbi:MAG: SAM-dependent methyltransferase [Clostridia bacterium]|nr:SAM-dependent methyltransferase [Clostridia bacterium]